MRIDRILRKNTSVSRESGWCADAGIHNSPEVKKQDLPFVTHLLHSFSLSKLLSQSLDS